MASLSNEKLRESIAEILKGADLSSLSSKKVRFMLEEKHAIELASRKKEVDAMIMEMISDISSSTSYGKKGSGSSATNGTSEPSGSESEEAESDEEYSPKKKKMKAAGKPVAKAPPAKKGKGKGDSSEEEEEEVEEKEDKKGKGKGGARKGKSTYSKKCVLSPELAEVMGESEMARHEVVKKMWQIVKERNLADPKNKQFALCDDQLFKVFGVKRFRTFGMMKFLKNHIKDPR